MNSYAREAGSEHYNVKSNGTVSTQLVTYFRSWDSLYQVVPCPGLILSLAYKSIFSTVKTFVNHDYASGSLRITATLRSLQMYSHTAVHMAYAQATYCTHQHTHHPTQPASTAGVCNFMPNRASIYRASPAL